MWMWLISRNDMCTFIYMHLIVVLLLSHVLMLLFCVVVCLFTHLVSCLVPNHQWHMSSGKAEWDEMRREEMTRGECQRRRREQEGKKDSVYVDRRKNNKHKRTRKEDRWAESRRMKLLHISCLSTSITLDQHALVHAQCHAMPSYPISAALCSCCFAADAISVS